MTTKSFMNVTRSTMNRINADSVEHYRWYGISLFADCGEDLRVRESRQRLFEAGIDNDTIREIDEIIIEATIVLDYVSDNAITDDDTRPLSHWWWHLGKIRTKSFPVEQLPEYLREVYLESKAK